MASHGLGRTHRHLIGGFAQGGFNGLGFRRVVRPSAGAVGVNVTYLLGCQASILKGQANAAGRPLATGHWGRHMVSIAGHAIADHLGINGSPPTEGMLQLLQDEDATPFTDHKAIPTAVKGTAGLGRLMVTGR